MGITGETFIGYFVKEGWKGSLPFYAFKCPTHGTVANYPMGYEKRLECPVCLEKRLIQLQDVAVVRPLEVADELVVMAPAPVAD
jgi:hypothetical protein